MTGTGWWRCDAVLGEAAANLWARRWRFLALVSLVAALAGALLWTELTTSRAAIADKRAFLAAGGTVVTVARDEGLLDGDRCAGLSGQAHVVAAGGVSRGEVVRFDHAPATPFQSVRVSGGVLRVLDPAAGAVASSGLVLSTGAATELGAGPGSSLALAGTVETVRTVVDVDSRAETLGRAVLLPRATADKVEQCWVEFHDGAYSDAVTTLPAWFAVDRLTVTPLIDRNRGTRDFAAEWSHRPGRHAWLAVTALITAFSLLLVWRGRAEVAVHVLLGTARPVAAVVQTLELWIAVTAGGLLGGLWGTAMASLTGDPGGAPLAHGLRAATLGLTASLALLVPQSAWLLRNDLVAILKQRPG